MNVENPPTPDSLINDLPGFVYRCRNDVQWTMLHLSDQVESITGYKPEELEYNRVKSYGKLIHPDDRASVWEDVQKALKAGRQYELVYRLRTKNQEERWIWEQGRGITENDGDVDYLQGFIQDITERKQVQLENHLFKRISKKISRSTDYRAAAESILLDISSVTGWGFTELWLVDTFDEERINAEVYYNPENGLLETFWQDSREIVCERGTGLVGRVWESDRLEWVQNLSENQGFIRTEAARDAGLETALGVPCRAEDETIGVFVIYLKDQHRRDKRMIDLMETMGEQIGSLLQRKKLDSQLVRQKNLLNQILEKAPADIWMIDLEFEEYIYTNPSFRETWGNYFEGVDDIREAFLEAVHPEDRDRIRQAITEPGARRYEHEFRIQRPADGDVRWYHDKAFVIRDEDGNPIRIVGIGEDITERKEAEQKLRTSSRRLSQLAENIDEVFYLCNRDFTEVLYLSRAYETLWGGDRDEVTEDPWQFLDYLYPEDRDTVRVKKKDFLANPRDTECTLEYRIERPDGEVRWMLDRMFEVEGEEGATDRIAGVVKDITDEKQVNRELKNALREKTTLYQELHHRVKNNIQLILGLIGLQKRDLEGHPEVTSRLDDLRNRVNAMGLIHKLLYRESRLHELNAQEYLESLTTDVLQNLKPPSLELDWDVDIDSVPLEIEELLPCGLILNELLSNAIRHGFANEEEGTVHVRLAENNDGTITLCVDDNGQGMETGSFPEDSSSLGGRIIRRLVDQLNGEIETTTENGLTVTVTFDPDGE